MRSSILGLIFFLSAILTATAQSVFITKTGTKYHKESCFHLKDSQNKLEYSKARLLEYTACKHCKPIGYSNVIESTSLQPKTIAGNKNSNSIQCSGKTKTGARCKRKTKNSNGRCYQH